MSFSDARWLGLLVVLPLLLLLEWLAARRGERALGALAGGRRDSALLSLRLPGRRRLSALLRTLALLAFVVAAGGPQWGREVVRRAAFGSDVVLVLDTSASMDVRDVAPTRLEEAKREASAVLDRLEGSRVALVAFAGDAVRLCPLTLDRSAARLLLEGLNSAALSEPGSDLGRGLRTAASLLPAGRNREQVVVVWTDGEDLERGAAAATEELARRGTRVLAVGVGTRMGDVVPVLDEQGRAVDVKRDEQGGPVRSRLDEGILRALARRTGGAYFSAARPGGELPRLLSALGHVGRGARGQRLVERPVPRFPWFAGLGLLLLAGDWLWPRRRALALAVALAALPAADAHAQSAWERGNRAYRVGQYPAAESLYRARLEGRDQPAVRVNWGASLARLKQDQAAESAWRSAAKAAGPAGQAALYNLGTWSGEKGELEKALAVLREALRRSPSDRDARHNYEVLLERQRQEQQAPQQRNQPQPAPSQPGQGSPQGSGSGQAPEQARAPQSAAPSPPPRQAPGTPAGMTPEQADWLQIVTEQSERELRRGRHTRVLRERRGRDW